MNEDEDTFERLGEHVATLHGVTSEMRLDLATWADDARNAGRHTLAHRLEQWQGVLSVLGADVERVASAELGLELP